MRRPSILLWVGAIAAAVVLSVAATTLIVGSRIDDRLTAQDQAIEDLAAVTTATIQVTSEPDAERVALDSPTGAATTGTLLYSPSTTDTVVVATGLERAARTARNTTAGWRSTAPASRSARCSSAAGSPTGSARPRRSPG